MTEIGEFSEENLKKAAALIKKGEWSLFRPKLYTDWAANALSEQAVLKFQSEEPSCRQPFDSACIGYNTS